MSIQKSGKNIDITDVHVNTSQELISITADKLKLILLEHLSQIEINKAWQMPLSLFVTIVLVFCSAEFKPAFGIPADTWRAIFIIGGVVCFIWVSVCLFRIKRGITVDDVIDAIKNRPH